MCPEWGDMSTCKMLFYRPSTKKKPKHVGLVQSRHYHHLVEMQLDIIWLKYYPLGVKQQLLTHIENM